MGQIEVYEFLKVQRASGCHDFFTCVMVEKALKAKGFSGGLIEGVKGDLLRLELSGYLEALVGGKDWRRSWRLKDKYIKSASSMDK